MKNTNTFKNTFDGKNYVLCLDFKPVLIPKFPQVLGSMETNGFSKATCTFN